MKVLFSIIIPHKKCPDLLNRCVSSIPIREDTEVIIVDDNSGLNHKDFQFIDSYRQCHIYFLEESKGAGYARNYAMRKANGTWFLFADADDYFDTKNLGILLDNYKSEKSVDIVYLNANKVNEEGVCAPINVSHIIENFQKRKSLKTELDLRYAMWSPWSRMVRRKLVVDNNISFEEIPIGNDTMFSLLCSSLSTNIDVFDRVIYYYFKPQNGSYTKRLYNDENIKGQLELALRVNSLYDKVGYKYKRTFLPFIISALIDKSIDRKNRISMLMKFYKIHNISFLSDLFNYIKFKLK